MAQPPLSTSLVVADVLSRWPQTVPVFLRHHMICVGCAMSRFETLEDISAIYRLDLNGFLLELRHAIEPNPEREGEAETMSEATKLDVRQTPPAHRHPLIFQTFEALRPGEVLILLNDHDPKPLYYQFKFEREGQFTWDYLEQGPEVWRVRIGRSG